MPLALIAALQEILPLIEKYGPTLISSIVGIFTTSTAPTQAQWDALLKSTSITAKQQMLDTLAAHGIDPASPAGQALLALTA